MSPASVWSVLVVPSLLLVLTAHRAEPQARNTAVLEIRVRSAAEAQALEGALVVVRGTGLAGTTDHDGLVLIHGVSDGTRVVDVRLLGYAPLSRSVAFHADSTSAILFELAVQPIGLDSVQAAATARRSNLMRRGFYERKRSGSGTFLTRDEIERFQPRFLSDVLRRVGGVQVGSSSRGLPSTQMRGQQSIAGSCPVQYYVDGVLTTAYSIDEMRPEDIDGIEVYRGAASIPASFKRGTASCGVILLWSRVR
jgi:outer membrane receptor protein involved in Fe transport